MGGWNVAVATDVGTSHDSGVSDHPLAYFITIRTYGTWLTGDSRGSVDDEHRSYGEPFKRRDDFRAGYQARRMKAQQLLITPPMRRIIELEVRRTCNYRRWVLHALNVRTNHVHLVVSSEQAAISVMREVKVYSTRALRRAGLVASEQPVWAEHGSTKNAWSEADVDGCVSYTLDSQGDDLPGSGGTNR
jgi:REP element-mobilizing transposase RayT